MSGKFFGQNYSELARLIAGMGSLPSEVEAMYYLFGEVDPSVTHKALIDEEEVEPTYVARPLDEGGRSVAESYWGVPVWSAIAPSFFGLPGETWLTDDDDEIAEDIRSAVPSIGFPPTLDSVESYRRRQAWLLRAVIARRWPASAALQTAWGKVRRWNEQGGRR